VAVVPVMEEKYAVNAFVFASCAVSSHPSIVSVLI